MRKSVYRLLITVLSKNKNTYLDLTLISANVLVNSLNIDQTGSSYEYVKTLTELSSKCPQVWTTYYSGSGKKSASRRLSQFLSKGSQGGPPDFWLQISRLLRDVLSLNISIEQTNTGDKPISDENSFHSVILEALHDGIIHKGEHRSGRSEAWLTYLQIAELVRCFNSTLEHKRKLTEGWLMPIVEQYIKPVADKSDWTVVGSDQQNICLRSICLIQKISTELFSEFWQRLSRIIIEDLQTSFPEQSKDYVKSQDIIVSEIKRWYPFQSAVLKSDEAGIMCPILSLTCLEELKSAINVITARNGKPYSAAVALLSIVEFIPDIMLHQTETRKALFNFAQDKVSNLLLSPSSPYLIELLYRLNDEQELHDASQKAIENLLDAPGSDAKSKALQSLVRSPWLARDVTSTALATVLRDNMEQALQGRDESWSLINTAMENPVLPSNLMDDLLSVITNGLSLENSAETALRGLNLAVKHKRRGLKGFSTSKQGPVLLSRLLFLAESPQSSVARDARDLNNSIQAIISSDESSYKVHQSIIEIIKKGLNTAEGSSLS